MRSPRGRRRPPGPAFARLSPHALRVSSSKPSSPSARDRSCAYQTPRAELAVRRQIDAAAVPASCWPTTIREGAAASPPTQPQRSGAPVARYWLDAAVGLGHVRGHGPTRACAMPSCRALAFALSLPPGALRPCSALLVGPAS